MAELIDRFVPRHLSILDPYYKPELGRMIEISVGGQAQRFVISYDIDAGEVVRHEVNPIDGKFIIDWQTGEVRSETVRGGVEVRFKR